jgi:hypothetical protein
VTLCDNAYDYGCFIYFINIYSSVSRAFFRRYIAWLLYLDLSWGGAVVDS